MYADCQSLEARHIDVERGPATDQGSEEKGLEYDRLCSMEA